MKRITMVMVMSVMLFAAVAEARVVRATELDSINIADLGKEKLGDVVVEFRQGDEIPLTFTASGDLLETTRATLQYITVKKNFWIRVATTDIQISFDGTNYKKISEALTGDIHAGAGSAQNGGVANAINVSFKALVK
jgi:hypothetical protein